MAKSKAEPEKRRARKAERADEDEEDEEEEEEEVKPRKKRRGGTETPTVKPAAKKPRKNKA